MGWTRFDTGCEVWWDEAHELVRVTHRQAMHDEHEARENIAAMARLRQARGIARAGLLIDIRELRTITREARLEYTRANTAATLLAGALLTDSVVSRVIANFFIAFSRPNVPYRMFNAYDAALQWLATFEVRHAAVPRGLDRG